MDQNDQNLNKSPPSAFCDLYKPSLQIDQSKRRFALLTEQKKRRENAQDANRGLGAEKEAKIEAQKGAQRYVREFNNKIMLSEWLIEVPDDLDVSWFMKICPQGYRCLVVAEKLTTKSYSKCGKFLYNFKSVLPGGILSHDGCKTTILDCIFCQKTQTFYILDALMWSSQDLTNCEAEFRFFWLQSKLAELPDDCVNKYSFKYIPHVCCDFLSIKQTLETFPYFNNNLPKVDGVLFYHKEASYSSGVTPLVGWLKPFMVPEILSIPVGQEYFKVRPEGYINLKQHIKKKPRKKSRKMEGVEVSLEEMEEG